MTGLPRQIVGIGPRRGANVPYLDPGTRVIAFEPNLHLHDDLRAAAAEHGIDLVLHAGDLQSGALDDASQDVVLSRLVLCGLTVAGARLERLGSNLDPTNLVYWGVAHR